MQQTKVRVKERENSQVCLCYLAIGLDCYLRESEVGYPYEVRPLICSTGIQLSRLIVSKLARDFRSSIIYEILLD